jgi:hypothetical protein
MSVSSTVTNHTLNTLNAVCRAILYEESPNLSDCHAGERHWVEQLIVLCYSVCCHENLVFSNLLLSND